MQRNYGSIQSSTSTLVSTSSQRSQIRHLSCAATQEHRGTEPATLHTQSRCSSTTIAAVKSPFCHLPPSPPRPASIKRGPSNVGAPEAPYASEHAVEDIFMGSSLGSRLSGGRKEAGGISNPLVQYKVATSLLYKLLRSFLGRSCCLRVNHT